MGRVAACPFCNVSMYQILAYYKFLWKSSNQHGVHSPFVYGLVTRCFYDKRSPSSYDLISRYRKTLLKKDQTIEVTDFGAGSRVFKSPKRKISDIAKTAGITPKRARLLNRLVRYLNIGSALELGTSLGLGSVALAAGNQVRVTTLEGCPNTAKAAQEEFKAAGFGNIISEVGDFGELFKDPAILESSYDLIYFDGNHQKQPTLEYFHQLLPLAHNNTVFIFDDIHWSGEMTEAWEEIKAHPSVKVSIDTFFWGFVFFRKEQEKEHFRIRI